MTGPISGYVVGQYFGLFNGVTKDDYKEIVATAPFEKCNLLILAFVHTVSDGTNYVAAFTNWRDNDFSLATDDTDIDRVKLVVRTARAKNPFIKILISLGWGSQDVALAAKNPGPFAQSVAAIVQEHGLDGFDIDYESVDVSITVDSVLTLAQQLKEKLDGVTPKREMIMTITPGKPIVGLDKRVLQIFTYTMPQTYQHGGDGTTADPYKKMLGSFDRIVYGVNSEGYLGDPQERPDSPATSAGLAKTNNAAGIFAWRLDNDNVDRTTSLPTFAAANEMWDLMKPPAAR